MEVVLGQDEAITWIQYVHSLPSVYIHDLSWAQSNAWNHLFFLPGTEGSDYYLECYDFTTSVWLLGCD